MRQPISQWHILDVTLWHAPGQAYGGETNAGISTVVELLSDAIRQGVQGIRVINASALSSEACSDIYMQHAAGAFWWQYEVRRAFGTNRYPGCLACRQVPLCSIRFQETEIPMVAPFSDNTTRPGRTVSILEAFHMLAPAEQERIFGRVV